MKSTHAKSKSNSEKYIIAPRNSINTTNTPVIDSRLVQARTSCSVQARTKSGSGSFIESDAVRVSDSNSLQESVYDELDILKFYTIKLNDIFSSFFIKYFNKLKDNYDTLKDFQIFLRNNEKENIDKGFFLFDTYIYKKYKLSFEDLNTSIYIYIKESLQKILNKKVIYEQSKDSKDPGFSRSEHPVVYRPEQSRDRNYLLKTLFLKCFKQICTNLYENPNSINHPLDLKKNITHSVKYTMYNIIPFDYTIKHYEDIQDNSQESEKSEKINESVKKYFYSDNNISKTGPSSDKKNKKSNKSYSKKKNKSISTHTISDMSYEHDSS